MRNFRELIVWQKSHDLTLQIYQCSQHFPGDERFGLTSQLRRSAASVPANLAEGSGRPGRAEYARFIGIAAGSALETEYHLLLAKDLGYLTSEEYQHLDMQIQTIKRMLAGLSQSLKS